MGNRSAAGYTLVEVLVALIFISLLTGGLLVYSRTGMAGNSRADRLSEANKILESEVEYLRVLARNGALASAGDSVATTGLPHYFNRLHASWRPWAADTTMGMADVSVFVFWSNRGATDSLGIQTLISYKQPG